MEKDILESRPIQKPDSLDFGGGPAASPLRTGPRLSAKNRPCLEQLLLVARTAERQLALSESKAGSRVSPTR